MARLQDERMRLIGEAILTQAMQEARGLIDKANAIHKAEIEKFENEIINGMFDKVQEHTARVRLESMKTTAKRELGEHRALLGYRAEKTEAVFNAVLERLSLYAQTREYKADMLGRARSLSGEYDHAQSDVLVREADMGLGNEIREMLGAAEVKADDSIRVGGFRLRNRAAHLLIDETLDERLEEQKLWFLQNCGMKIM